MRRILPSIWALMIYGCGLAYPEPVQIAFAPQFPFAPINIGSGAPLHVSFADDTAQPVVGYRIPRGPWGSPTPMGAITLSPPVEPDVLAFFYGEKQIWLLEGYPLTEDFERINEIGKKRFRPLISDTTSLIVERYPGFAGSQVRIAAKLVEAAKPDGFTITALAADSSLRSDPNNEKTAGFEYQKLESPGGVEASAPGHLILSAVSSGVPKERVAYLGSGFSKVARDREFVAARKIKFLRPDAVSERIAKTPPGVATTTQESEIP